MILESLTLSGFSPAFPGVVDIPFRTLPAGVYAFTGENGAGKTTLLEASGPGPIFRQMPSCAGADPVTYASRRDSFLDLTFACEGLGRFRARLNLDGPKRQTDAVLERIEGEAHVPINNGQRSTYDLAIAARFPSIDLFLNSAFAAQGRGDEFSRRKPSERKDLFVEFLALQHLAQKAVASTEAAARCDDARLRLAGHVEVLERETAQQMADALEQLAETLQVDGGTAELRQRELRATIANLDARAAIIADQVSAYTVATERLQTLTRDQAGRVAEREALRRERDTIGRDTERQGTALQAQYTADVQDVRNKIAGNQKIQEIAEGIRAAIAATAAADRSLAIARDVLFLRQQTQAETAAAIRIVEAEIAGLVQVELRLDRATTDAAILDTVPCGGTGPYAECQFLVNAKDAQLKLAHLEQQIVPKAALADRLATLLRDAAEHRTFIAERQAAIAALEASTAEHAKLVAYREALAGSDARLTELRALEAKLGLDVTARAADLNRQLRDRLAACDARAAQLDAHLADLDVAVFVARTDQERAATGNTEAVELQGALAAARREWDTVTSTLARVTSGRQELDRRRTELTDKRARLTDARGKLAAVQQELVEWRDLAKACGKNGLQEIEIDIAGPGISATANALLLSCLGPRYTLELVTQTAKADGSGMKDDFTVKVIDNAVGGDWRDISRFSGGQKTILQEALMCAIALYVNERSPMPIRTLWRDETGAALSAENAIHYVHMLRKVRELGRFHHVFFISHNAEAAALADAQIRVADGQAAIVWPPFSEVA